MGWKRPIMDPFLGIVLPVGRSTLSCLSGSSPSPVQYVGLRLWTASCCRSRRFAFVLACFSHRLRLRYMIGLDFVFVLISVHILVISIASTVLLVICHQTHQTGVRPRHVSSRRPSCAHSHLKGVQLIVVRLATWLIVSADTARSVLTLKLVEVGHIWRARTYCVLLLLSLSLLSFLTPSAHTRAHALTHSLTHTHQTCSQDNIACLMSGVGYDETACVSHGNVISGFMQLKSSEYDDILQIHRNVAAQTWMLQLPLRDSLHGQHKYVCVDIAVYGWTDEALYTNNRHCVRSSCSVVRTPVCQSKEPEVKSCFETWAISLTPLSLCLSGRVGALLKPTKTSCVCPGTGLFGQLLHKTCIKAIAKYVFSWRDMHSRTCYNI